jgi:hypothetical protein
VSEETIRAVMDRGPRDLAGVSVMLAIARAVEPGTADAWLAQWQIARVARLTERAVRKVVGRLSREGWLVVGTSERPDRARLPNWYRLNAERLGVRCAACEGGAGVGPRCFEAAKSAADGWSPWRSTLAGGAHHVD